MTSTKKTLRATFAAIAAATLTMTATPYALAADDTDTSVPGTSNNATTLSAKSLKTMPAQANLVIHKSVQAPDSDTPNNGTRQESKEGVLPVKGVKFKVYRLGGEEAEGYETWDLKTNEGWRKANKAVSKFNKLVADKSVESVLKSSDFTYEDEGEKKVKVAYVDEITTDGRGEAALANQAAGVYAVVEQPIKSDSVKVGNAEGKLEPLGNRVLGRAIPFIVFLPMTDQSPKQGGEDGEVNTDKWLKTVNVYPKNSISGISKAVADTPAPGAGAGDKSVVTYTVKTDIPKGFGVKNDAGTVTNEGAAENALTSYQVIDKLSKLTTYKETTSVKLVQASDGTAPANGDSDLTVDTDYTVTQGTGEYANIVTVAFTPAGLEKLVNVQGANPNIDLKLVWDLTAKINDLSQKFKDGDTDKNVEDITNEAILVPPNNSNGTWKPGDSDEDFPRTKVTSKYGKVKITKVKEDGTTPLNGATFQLFTCNKDGEKTDYSKPFNREEGTFPKFDNQDEATPVKVNGKDTWVSGEDDANPGLIEIKGLQLNNWNNADSEKGKDGSFGKNDKPGYYCLFEIKAPAGYELLPEPVQFQLLDGTGDGANQGLYEANVKNVPNNDGFNLPLTGGKGVLPLIALGGLLVVGAGGYAAVAAKRNRKEA